MAQLNKEKKAAIGGRRGRARGVGARGFRGETEDKWEATAQRWGCFVEKRMMMV